MKNFDRSWVVYGVGGGYAGEIIDKIKQEVLGQTTNVTMYLINRKLSYEFEEEGYEGWKETKECFEVVSPKSLKRFLTSEEYDNLGILKQL